MRVCYVTHEPNLTGASQSLLDMLDGLKGSSVEPVVLLRKKGPLEEELRKRNIAYHIIYYAQSIRPIHKKQVVKNLLKRPVNALAEKKIAEFLRSMDIDLVHSNSLLAISGMKAARRVGISYICHIRELLEEDHQIIPVNPADTAECIRKASRCIAISDFVFGKYSAGIEEGRGIVLRNGISVGKYYQRHGTLFNGDTVKVLLAGRLQENKGQLDAIKAIEIITAENRLPIKLYIAGGDAPSTDYPQLIRNYVREKKLSNVRFLDFTDLKELRAECDISLTCSTHEALGRVTIEGMLSGCLAIGADAGATPEIISDGETGYLYKAGDPEELAACILKAYEEADASNEIASRGQSYAMRFDSKNYTKKILKIYDEIAES